MNAFERKTLRVSRGYTYTYYVADGDRTLPALLFQHGWPDNAAMWKDVAAGLRPLNHPMIMPDLLGFDGTDKPTDPAKYRWDVMVQDLIDIIDAEGHAKVISIGHDWGSGCASRVYNLHPKRVAGIVNLNVAYMAPSTDHFDLNKTNMETAKVFGYSVFSYWDIHAGADGAGILHANIGRIYEAMHGEGETMKDIFCGPGRMREHLLHGSGEITMRPYARDEKFKQDFIDRMSRDGFEAPQCWYKATAQNYNHEVDKTISEADRVVNVPVLFIGTTEDPVCRHELINGPRDAGLLPQLEQAPLIEAAHWVPYEAPQEIVVRMESWLKKNYAR